MPAVISVSHLTKTFSNTEALTDVSFDVQEGSIFGYLGPNGSGKTTTVRLLNGLLNADSGSISIFGEQMNSQNDTLRKNVGVQTDTNLYERLTAYENLYLWGELFEMSHPTIEKQIQELLVSFNLHERKNDKVATFSKGMKQKLSIARALIHSPKLLFLDEPTAGLDPESASELLTLLHDYVKNYGATVFLCSHRLEEVEKLCDSIGIIHYGKLLTSGSIDALINKTWPEQQYDLKIGPTVPAKLAKRFDSLIKNSDSQLIGRITLSAKENISEIIRDIVISDCSLYEVKEVKHSLLDLYFKVINTEHV